jgi:catalase
MSDRGIPYSYRHMHGFDCCPFHNYHRDGAMRVDGNHGSTLGYEPNSYGE